MRYERKLYKDCTQDIEAIYLEVVKIFHMDDPKKWANLGVGFLLILFGGIPLASQFGLIGFGMPEFIDNIVGNFAIYIIAAVGLWLIIDAFMEEHAMKNATLIVAGVFLMIGVIQMLGSFGVLPFQIPIPVGMFYGIFLIEGVFLVLASFMTF
jgi:hypothetical protein